MPDRVDTLIFDCDRMLSRCRLATLSICRCSLDGLFITINDQPFRLLFAKEFEDSKSFAIFKFLNRSKTFEKCSESFGKFLKFERS